jgi:hypothetical protein
MISFKDYSLISEGRYPNWLKFVTGGLVLKVRNLSTRIKSETDPKKQNELISQQMNLISYIVGLGIGVSSRDNVMMNRFKKGIGGPVKK